MIIWILSNAVWMIPWGLPGHLLLFTCFHYFLSATVKHLYDLWEGLVLWRSQITPYKILMHLQLKIIYLARTMTINIFTYHFTILSQSSSAAKIRVSISIIKSHTLSFFFFPHELTTYNDKQIYRLEKISGFVFNIYLRPTAIYRFLFV